MRAVGIGYCWRAAAFAADANTQLSQAQIDDIIQKFAAKEAAFAKARENYTYRQTARIQEARRFGQHHGGRWEDGVRHHFHAGRQAHRTRGAVAGADAAPDSS